MDQFLGGRSAGQTIAGVFKVSMAEKARGISTVIQGSMQKIGVSMFAAAGKALAAGKSLTGVLGAMGKAVLTTLADLAVRVGKIAIGVGVAVEGIRKALETLNPFVAIAAGAALVAVGSWAKSALSKSAKGSGDTNRPEMAIDTGNMASMDSGGITTQDGLAMVHSQEAVIPLDRLNKMVGSAGGAQTIHVTGELRGQGQDLIGIFRKALRAEKKAGGKGKL